MWATAGEVEAQLTKVSNSPSLLDILAGDCQKAMDEKNMDAVDKNCMKADSLKWACKKKIDTIKLVPF